MQLNSLDYVILIVDDIDKAQHFYTKTLGLPLKHRSGEYAQIALSGTRLGLFSRSAMASTLDQKLEPESSSTKFELGFKVENCDTAFEELVACGVPAVTEPQTRSWGQRTAYLTDPDGNLIELVENLPK